MRGTSNKDILSLNYTYFIKFMTYNPQKSSARQIESQSSVDLTDQLRSFDNRPTQKPMFFEWIRHRPRPKRRIINQWHDQQSIKCRNADARPLLMCAGGIKERSLRALFYVQVHCSTFTSAAPENVPILRPKRCVPSPHGINVVLQATAASFAADLICPKRGNRYSYGTASIRIDYTGRGDIQTCRPGSLCHCRIG